MAQKLCIEGCGRPVAGPDQRIAGTARRGSRFWCAEHEAARIARINRSFDELAAHFGICRRCGATSCVCAIPKPLGAATP